MKRRMDRWNYPHDDSDSIADKRTGRSHFLEKSSGNLDQQIKSLKSQINKFGFKTSHSASSKATSHRSVESSQASVFSNTSSSFAEPEERAFSDYRRALQGLDGDSAKSSSKSRSSSASSQTGNKEIVRLSEAAASSSSALNRSQSSSSSSSAISSAISHHSRNHVSYRRSKKSRNFSVINLIKKRFNRIKKTNHSRHPRHHLKWRQRAKRQFSNRKYHNSNSYYDHHHRLGWYLIVVVVIVLACGGILYYQQYQDHKIIEKANRSREQIEMSKPSLAIAGRSVSNSQSVNDAFNNLYGSVNKSVKSTDIRAVTSNLPVSDSFEFGADNESFKKLNGWCNRVNLARRHHHLTVVSVIPKVKSFKDLNHQVVANAVVNVKYRRGHDVKIRNVNLRATLVKCQKGYLVTRLNR